jgi:CRISPR-associated protein Csb2
MLAIGAELLAGSMRATSADDLAATGETDPGEWPPSPARLFAAFVAADGTGDRRHVTTGDELSVLERAGEPVILADRCDVVARSTLWPRFVVVDARAKESVQDYPARSATEVRPGTRISPRTPRVWFTWPELEIGPRELKDLQTRAARIGYLGCADSPVRIRVQTEAPAEDTLARWVPSDATAPERVALPIVYDGYLEVLDGAFERFSRGEATRRAWLASVRRWYATDPAASDDATPSTVWLRFESPLPGRQALAVADALRRATLELYDRWSAPVPGDLPGVLTGHGFSGTGYQHVHWLVLPDVGHRHASGRLHGAAVWFPPGTAREVVAGVRSALGHLSELVTATGRVTRVRLYDGARRPVAATPQRWTGPASRWASALPVVHERWGKMDAEQVSAWCRHGGLPDPVAFRSAVVAFVDGGVALRPHEVHRAGRERRPYSHLLVEFAEPVTGPIMLGRSRQFGLGLLCPLDSIAAAGPGGSRG